MLDALVTENRGEAVARAGPLFVEAELKEARFLMESGFNRAE